MRRLHRWMAAAAALAGGLAPLAGRRGPVDADELRRGTIDVDERDADHPAPAPVRGRGC